MHDARKKTEGKLVSLTCGPRVAVRERTGPGCQPRKEGGAVGCAGGNLVGPLGQKQMEKFFFPVCFLFFYSKTYSKTN